MKFSAALALSVAPVALAKAAHNVMPVRREPGKHASKSAARQIVGGSSLVDPAFLAQSGLVLGSRQELVIIWVNQGGGAPTQNINPIQTVTQTVTAGSNGQVVGGAPGSAATLQPLNGQGQQVGAGQVGVAPTGAGSNIAPGAQVGANGRPPIPITVGGPKGIQFEPQDIKAQVGDLIIFTFLSQNHSVTQSAFATPCQPLAEGMDTGFQPNMNNSVNPAPQIAMQVMVDTPLWFYCKQNNHCGKGMVFSVNAKADKTHAMFQSMAIAQNGVGQGSAITGNGGAAPAGANNGQSVAPAGSSLPAAGGVESTGTLNQLPPLDTAVGAAPPAGTGVVTGTGTLLPNGECSCAVECGAGAFPAVQAQGVNNFGGVGGSIPASMVGLR